MNAPRVVVNPPSFSKSPSLRAELSSHFSNTAFNEKDIYLSGYELVKFLKNAGAAMIGRDLISAELIRSLPSLKMVSKYVWCGAG
jgi:hypothetical protein